MEKDEQNTCPVCLEEIDDNLTECNKCHNFIHKICEKMCNKKCPICRTVHEEWEINIDTTEERDMTLELDELSNLIFPRYSSTPQFGQEYSYTINTTGDFSIHPVSTIRLPSISNTTSGFIENNYTTLAQRNIGVTYNIDIPDSVTSLNYLTTTEPLNDYFLRQTRNNTWFRQVPIIDDITNDTVRPNRSSWFLGTPRISSSETSQETIEKKDRKKQMRKLERRNRGKKR